jgi:hypothetical protein
MFSYCWRLGSTRELERSCCALQSIHVGSRDFGSGRRNLLQAVAMAGIIYSIVLNLREIPVSATMYGNRLWFSAISLSPGAGTHSFSIGA